MTARNTTGAAAGGKSRAEVLSPERRREIAQQAAQARWHAPLLEGGDLPRRATHEGELVIGDMSLPCAVLEGGIRVISERGVTRALGTSRWGTKRHQAAQGRNLRLPVYVLAPNLLPYMSPSLQTALSRPIIHLQKRSGSRPVYGMEAALLPEICNVWLKARDAGVLTSQQAHIVAKADLLMRGLAHVGIIALVDEATGFQEERDREELHRILEAYINKELLPWSKTFPDEYYKQLFKLRGWQYSPPSVKRPHLVGKLTHDLIYKRLPYGVIEVLKQKNPVDANGRRRHKHFQFLTEDIGEPHLKEQLVAVTTLMRAATTWGSFLKLFDRAFPGEGVQQEMDLGLPDEDP